MSISRAGSDWDWFWSDVDPQVRGSLTETQKRAISGAVKRKASQGIPADVRFSFAGFFLVLMFGKERRDGARRKAEQIQNPVLTVRNVPVISILFGSIAYTTLSLSGYLFGL